MNIDKNISTNFLKNGYVIVDIDDLKSLDKIMKLITAKIRKIIKIPKNIDDFSLLNNFHKYMNVSNLNTRIVLSCVQFTVFMREKICLL